MSRNYMYMKPNSWDRRPRFDPKVGQKVMERRLTRTSTAMQNIMNRDLPTYQQQQQYPEYQNHFNNNVHLGSRSREILKFLYQNTSNFDESSTQSLTKAADLNRNSIVHLPKSEEKESGKRLLYVLKGVTSFYPPSSTDPFTNQFARVSELSSSFNDHLFAIDMKGFKNQNIQIFLRGKSIIVEGVRPSRPPYINQRKTREIVPIPARIRGDNLRIARNANGMLIFEEAWKF